MAGRRLKEFLHDEVPVWFADGAIDKAALDALRERYEAEEFGWSGVVKYLGITGGLFAFFGTMGTIAAISASKAFGTLLLAGVGGAGVWWGLELAKDLKERYSTSSKVIVTLGAFLCSGGAGLAGAALGFEGAAAVHFSAVLCLPAMFFLAYQSRNSYLLLLGVLGLFHWIGAWNGMAGRSTYAFALQDPRLMSAAALGAVLVGLYHELHLYPATGRFYKVWQTVGLVYLNLSLLILSSWKGTPDETPEWIVVFTAACLGQLVAGARLRSGLLRGFGTTFLVIDIFTRYHEFFWSRLALGSYLLGGGIALAAIGGALELYARRAGSGEAAS